MMSRKQKQGWLAVGLTVGLLIVAAGLAGGQVRAGPVREEEPRGRERDLGQRRALEARRAAVLAERRKEEAIRRTQEIRVIDQIQVAPAPHARSGIFVPAPKGAGETLDDSAQPVVKSNEEIVTTVHGDRLVGRVLGMAEGKLRFTAGHYAGEVVILGEALSQVKLGGKVAEAGQHQVILSNGDHIAGVVTAITPDAVVIESTLSGVIKVSRKVVSSIIFSGAKPMSASSDFSSGSMEPWKVRGGNWSVKNGQLVSTSRGSTNNAVYAPLEQGEAVTFVAKVKATGGHNLYCYLVPFADSMQGTFGRNSVYARFRSNDCRIGYAHNGGSSTQWGSGMNRVVREGELRFAYEPETGKSTAWIDSKKLGEYTFPPNLRPKKGKFVMFISRYPAQMSYLRVLRGVVPPSQGAGGGTTEKPETHTLKFANEDSVSVTSISLADGSFTADTPFAQVHCPLAKVQSIVFGSKDQEKPRLQKGDVLVQLQGSRLTLEFERLDEVYLLGKADHLGQVKLRRRAIKSIRFNIHE